MGGKRNLMITKKFAIVNAVYYDTEGTQRLIAGVPEYYSDHFGDYNAKYPYEAASKAFTGLQKHLKKFRNQRQAPEEPWFPNYDPENPPIIIFVIQDLTNNKQYAYQGQRIRHVQSIDGPRIVRNENDDRVREYNWANDIMPLKLDDVLA